MQQGWLTRTFKGDRIIWGLVVLFMFYSLLAVYSSSVGVAFMKYGGNTTYFLRTQFLMLALSLVIIVVTHYLPYRIYFSMAGLFLIISVGLLILTFAFGSRVNEATGGLSFPVPDSPFRHPMWQRWPLSFTLPGHSPDSRKSWTTSCLSQRISCSRSAVICALILPENLSTSLMIFGISMIIMFIGRVPFRFLLTYIGLGVAGVILFALLLSMVSKTNRVQVWKNRIEHFVTGTANDDEDYQSNQAKIAISTGGLFGKAPGKSTQRNMLPQSNSDFIFAIIIEEYGLLFGAIPLISGLYDTALQGNNDCPEMRNSISGLHGYGAVRNDCDPGYAEHACGCGPVPGYRADASHG